MAGEIPNVSKLEGEGEAHFHNNRHMVRWTQQCTKKGFHETRIICRYLSLQLSCGLHPISSSSSLYIVLKTSNTPIGAIMFELVISCSSNGM